MTPTKNKIHGCIFLRAAIDKGYIILKRLRYNSARLFHNMRYTKMIIYPWEGMSEFFSLPD